MPRLLLLLFVLCGAGCAYSGTVSSTENSSATSGNSVVAIASTVNLTQLSSSQVEDLADKLVATLIKKQAFLTTLLPRSTLEEEQARITVPVKAAIEEAKTRRDSLASQAIANLIARNDESTFVDYLSAERKKALGTNGAPPGIYDRELATTALASGKLNEAEVAANAILADTKDDYLALNVLGRIAFLRGDLPKTKQIFTRLLRIATDRRNREVEMLSAHNLGLAYIAEGDFSKAESMLTQSMGLAKDLGQNDELAVTLSLQASIDVAKGQLTQAERKLRDGIAIAERSNSSFGLVSNLSGLGELLSGKGELAEAQTLYEKARDLSHALESWEGLIQCRWLAVLYGMRGDLRRAEESYKETLSVAERVGSPLTLASAQFIRGRICDFKGDLPGTENAFRDALKLYKQTGNLPNEGYSSAWLGYALLQKADNQGAESFCDRALLIGRTLGIKPLIAIAECYRGQVSLARGDAPAAEASFLSSIQHSKELDFKLGLAINYMHLARLYGTAKKVDKAINMHEASIALCRELGHREGVARNMELLGHLQLFILQNPGKAEELYRSALTINQETGNKVYVASNLMNLGYVSKARMALPQAITFFQEALPWAKEGSDTTAQMTCYTELADLYIWRRDLGAARQALMSALQLSTELGDAERAMQVRQKLSLLPRY